MSNEREPEYLGDGVYASFDGYHIWLRTGAHEGPGVTNVIALEPSVYRALLRYYDKRVLDPEPESEPERAPDDEAAARADHEYDQAKDDRLTGDG